MLTDPELSSYSRYNLIEGRITMSTNKKSAGKAITEKQTTSVKLFEVQRFHPESRVNRIAALEVGESVSESKRLTVDEYVKGGGEKAMASLKQTMSTAAARAGKKAKRKFTTECGEFKTRFGHVIVCAVVTRTA